jgi:hypothetical protein
MNGLRNDSAKSQEDDYELCPLVSFAPATVANKGLDHELSPDQEMLF